MLLLTGALKYLNKLFLTVYRKYVLNSHYADIQIIIILNWHLVLQHENVKCNLFIDGIVSGYFAMYTAM